MNFGRGTLHALWGGRGRGRSQPARGQPPPGQPAPEQPGPQEQPSPTAQGVATVSGAPVQAQHASEGSAPVAQDAHEGSAPVAHHVHEVSAPAVEHGGNAPEAQQGDEGSAPAVEHAHGGNAPEAQHGDEGGSVSEGGRRAGKKPKYLPMSYVPLAELGCFEEVGPTKPDWLVCLPCSWAMRKEFQVRAHKQDSVNSHIGKKDRTSKTEPAPASAAGPSAPSLPAQKPKPAPINPHQQNKARWEQHKQQQQVQQEQQEAGAQQANIRVLLQAAGMEQMRQKLVQFAMVLHLLQHQRPMLAYEQLMELHRFLYEMQLTNSMPMKHWSPTSGWKIARFLAAEVQDELRRRIQRAPFIGISLDEASAIGHTAWLSMHTYIVDKGAREPYFLGVMEITGAPNAVNLAAVVIKALIDIGGLSLQQIGSKLVGIAADGASVMAGELSGVLQRIQASHAPWVLPMHCMGHRVNLVSCGLSNVGLMVKLEYMQSKVFTYFSHSNKKYYDYEAVQADVGVPRHELLRGVDTRWLSILAALDRLWEQYPALLVYFDKEAAVKDNFQALEVWHALIDCEGILGLLLTLPLLRRLNSLIKCMQERGLFLHDAIAAIKSTREDINAWYLDPATACQGTAFRTYQQIVHGDAEVSPLVWVPVGAHGTENLAFEVRLPLGSDRLPRASRVFMLCSAKPGVRRGVDSRLPVGHDLFSELITHVRQQAFEAGQAVDDDLLARFPAGSVHEQLCIVDLRHHAVRNEGPVQPSSRAAARERQQHQQQCVDHQRQCQQHKEQFMSFANSLAERFGHVLSPLMAERPLEPPLNGTLLMEQADSAYQIMGDAQLAGRETPAFWASVAGNVDQRGRVSEWLQLARIASVQVPGSVEEERLFSKLAFIKDERRNRLEAEHLNVCLILATQRMYSFTDFPYISAMRKWFAARERRLAAVPWQPQQPRQPIVVNIDSD
ncbi:hypothetical protein DUNSADRAFT_9913 [Dunaliella salina]|uniref:DUF4371 domain-containing protein n=1 Tax=Dunaliella salina TaxID=3046 RepID=A0ABQ7GGH9_DUNSA|nr:hypothetical protein DUNSADRAFT_9913 [Dunaliella salina]|eukprot:KAF5833715.1 hypothetical protein DUNSADRAFT_9913 [Dunaliella salina]